MTDAPPRDDFAQLRRWFRASGEPQASLLRWCRTVGYARHGGVSVDLRAPPAVAGDDIEYLPGVRLRIDGREMSAAERDAIRALLEQMCCDARDALAGHSTLVVVHERDAAAAPADEVLVGYLVTLRDGTPCRLGPDLTLARQYYAQRHAAGFEPMFVRRPQAAQSATDVTPVAAVSKGAAPAG